jgi:hypothetical protein
MKTKTKPVLIAVSLALILFTFWTCKQSTVSEPSPLGPSSIATILKLTATPNVLFVGQLSRPTTDVVATLTQYSGAPLSGRTVFFEVVNSSGTRVDLGYFDQKVPVQTVTTDADGIARTTYYGPLWRELTHDRHLYIRATVSWEGSQFINDETTLWIIRDSN